MPLLPPPGSHQNNVTRCLQLRAEEERQPQLRGICHLPRICCVSANLAHSWELAGHAWGIALTETEQNNCFAHNYPKTAGSWSQRLKRGHRENLGVRLQDRHRFRLQKTGCREEFIPASVTLHTDVLLYRGECTSHSSDHSVHGSYTYQGREHLSFMPELFSKAKAKILAIIPPFSSKAKEKKKHTQNNKEKQSKKHPESRVCYSIKWKSAYSSSGTEYISYIRLKVAWT